MTFELLPNEIIIECFEYLNGSDIFYSFDELNSHFSTLIRSIRLYVNFQNTNKLVFKRFCQKMLLNPNIKHQIISLNIPNDSGFVQIEYFLSYFSFEQFPYLQSLTLKGYIDRYIIPQIISMLTSLKHLHYFHFYHQYYTTSHLPLSLLFKLKFKTLSLAYFDRRYVDQSISLTTLNFIRCDIESLLELFQYTPLLKYLNIERLIHSESITRETKSIKPALHLKRLTIGTNYSFSFIKLEDLLKQTPNLNILRIFSDENTSGIIDAHRWQMLITFLLPYLTNFQFIFNIYFLHECENIITKFQEFQTEFWHKKHHWYTNYEINYDSAIIYTLPYLSNEYRLTLNTHTNSDMLNNVTDLYLPINVITNIKDSKYYFRNIKSLLITNPVYDLDKTINYTLEIYHISSLKIIMNLFNIKHLYITDSVLLKSSFVLLEILKGIPQLFSLDFDTSNLLLYLKNNELCEYLNKMIKILKIYKINNEKIITSDELDLFCKTFSNLEYLQCWIDTTDILLFILQKLSKLSKFEFNYDTDTFPENLDIWIEDNALKLNNNCVFIYLPAYMYTKGAIWLNMLPKLFYTINFSFSIVFSIIALLFGFLTILIVIINRQHHTIANLMTCNSAMAVIYYYIYTLTSSIYAIQDDWSSNQSTCVFRGYCFISSCTALCYSYLFQAISRLFFAVFYKHKYLLTWRVHWLMIAFNWILSITIPIFPIFYDGGYSLEEESHLCTATTKMFHTSIYCVIAAYLIPLYIMTIIYGIIFYYARQSTRRVIPSDASPTAANNSHIVNIKREMKLMQNIMILVGILTCGGTPYLILVLWHVTQHSPPESFYLLIINSVSFFTALMMIVLFWMSKDVRKYTIEYLQKLY